MASIITPPPPGVPAAIPQPLVFAVYILPDGRVHVRGGPQSSIAPNCHAALAAVSIALADRHGGTAAEHLAAARTALEVRQAPIVPASGVLPSA